MSRPRSLIQLSTMLALILFIFSSPSFVSAGTDCNQDVDQIDYKGPFSTIFNGSNANSTDKDCSYPEENSPLIDEVIYGGDVKCVQMYLNAKNVKEATQSNSRLASGSKSTSMKEVSSYAIGGELLDKKDGSREKLTGYGKVVEAYKNYDISQLYREAYGDGVNTYDEFLPWAAERGLTINGPNGPHLNPSIFSATQYQTTLKEQILRQYDTAKEITMCNEPAYANTHRCSTFYVTKVGGTDTVIDIARMTLENIDKKDPLGSWEELTEGQRWKIMTLHLTRSSPAFILYLPEDAMCQGTVWQCFFKFLNDLFEIDYLNGKGGDPGYIQVMLPETTNILIGAQDEYDRFNPLNKNVNGTVQSNTSTNTLLAENPSITDAVDLTAIKPRLLAQANNSPTNPGTFVTSTGKPLLDKLMQRAIDVDSECNKSPITQSENLGSTADSTKNPNVINRIISFVAAGFTEATTKPELYHVYIFTPPDIIAANDLLAKDSSSMLRKLRPVNTVGYTEELGVPWALTGSAKADTPSPTPYPNGEKNPSHFEYEKSFDNVPQPGGWFPQRAKLDTFGTFRPLNSPDNIKDQRLCLLEDHLQPGAQANGFDLVSALNAGQFSQTSGSCPDPIKPGDGTSTDDGDICTIANKYNVPCDYLKAIWEIESEGATSCADSNDDGPMQITDTAANIGDTSIIDGRKLNKCKLHDAWELAARTLLWKKYCTVQNCSTWNPNNPTGQGHKVEFSLNPNSKDLQTTGQYNGSNECWPSNVTQCRWGAGVSYCDAVIRFSKTGKLPPDNCSPQFCAAAGMSCN